MKAKILCILLMSAACILGYNVRIYFPVPYILKLRMLDKWPSTGIGSVNCSGLITAAHDSDFMESYEMYNSDKLDVIMQFDNVERIDDMMLFPGDIAVFEGTGKLKGVHVAAYLGNGRWTDSDSRRGYVTQYSMRFDKSQADPWFRGHVKIVRFK